MDLRGTGSMSGKHDRDVKRKHHHSEFRARFAAGGAAAAGPGVTLASAVGGALSTRASGVPQGIGGR